MFSVRQAVRGNNKNKLKWRPIHYNLSFGMASPLFPLFFPSVYKGTSESMCSQTVNIKCKHCAAPFLAFPLSYLFRAMLISEDVKHERQNRFKHSVQRIQDPEGKIYVF